jgi:copper homeostasis protein
MLLEICTNSYQSAKNAQEAGAHRIELCQELSVGGITPSYGLLKQVIENLEIPVFVLIRPRGGNFVYSEVEFEIMKSDIQLCKDLGCQGIVSGVLNADNSIDISRTRELVELSKPLAFTFHRAFDEVLNPKQALEQLIGLGVDRVLTSGQEATAELGIALLQELNEISKSRITILAGAGISAENALTFQNLKQIIPYSQCL